MAIDATIVLLPLMFPRVGQASTAEINGDAPRHPPPSVVAASTGTPSPAFFTMLCDRRPYTDCYRHSPRVESLWGELFLLGTSPQGGPRGRTSPKDDFYFAEFSPSAPPTGAPVNRETTTSRSSDLCRTPPTQSLGKRQSSVCARNGWTKSTASYTLFISKSISFRGILKTIFREHSQWSATSGSRWRVWTGVFETRLVWNLPGDRKRQVCGNRRV